MSPDAYLGLTSFFVSYFLKIAVACLVCWILATLLRTPRQRFTIWLSFTLGSLAYWAYAVTTFSLAQFSSADGGAILHSVAQPAHTFVVPTKFQDAIVIFGRFLGGVYMLGVLLLVALGIWKRIRLRLLLRRGMAPSAGLQQMFAAMCRHFGVRHGELVVLSEVRSPATVYWWRPRVVLPKTCEQMGESGLMADILSHELAHVARRDYLWTIISDVACGLLFFHPGVWQARKQMRIHRELACDLAVVSARPEHRADYAHTLTQVARLCLPHKYPVIGVDFAATPSLLRHRVHAILDDAEKSSRGKRVSRAVAGMALIVAYGFLCSAIAIALAFAPLGQGRMPSITSLSKPPAATPPIPKIKRAHPQPEAETLITESPAYRLPSASRSSNYTPEFSAASGAHGADEPSAYGGSTGGLPDSKRSTSVTKTVESVIVSTVGTVLAGDKDDRSNTGTKKK